VTVLVTRPRNDSEKTIARLVARGIKAIAAPALEIEPLDNVALPADVRAFLITSANAVQAVRARPDFDSIRSIPVFAVGDRTASTAREAGFATVESAGGDVDTLSQLIIKTVDPSEGLLVHLGGQDVAGNLSGTLTAAGYAVERCIVYRTARPARLPDSAISALKDGTVEAVLLYSPKSAEVFAALVAEAGLADQLGTMAAVAISRNVAEKARAAGFGYISVANNPDESQLFEALERFLKDRAGN
jgi:uroporphyrinogen-III synthase